MIETPASIRNRAAYLELKAAAREVMDLLEQHGPSIVPHLLDTDENPGQRLRDLLGGYENPNITHECACGDVHLPPSKAPNTASDALHKGSANGIDVQRGDR